MATAEQAPPAEPGPATAAPQASTAVKAEPEAAREQPADPQQQAAHNELSAERHKLAPLNTRRPEAQTHAQPDTGAAPVPQPPAPSAEHKRREWELKRKHALVSAEVEALTSKVVKRRRMSRIPPAATARALTQEETDKLAKAHKDRLWEIVGRQAPGILKAVRAHKWAWPFDKPVDQERFRDYAQKVSRPMDLGTIQAKVDRWGYTTPQEFADDMRLVFDNCRRYNAPDQEVVVMGNTLESKYEEKWGSLMVPKLTEEEHACAADEAAIRDLIFIDLQSKAAAELARQAADMADQFAAIKQRIAQAKAEAAALIPPLTNADKARLRDDLNRLPDNQFYSCIESIIIARDPNAAHHTEPDYDLNLEALDAPCLRALQGFCEASLAPATSKQGFHAWPNVLVGAGAPLPAAGRRVIA